MSDTASVSGFSVPSKSVAKKDSTSSLSLDRAAFLMIRIKRIFQKKKSKNKSLMGKTQPLVKKSKPPMLRAKTLPAIIPPSLNIIQAQLETPIDERETIAELPSDETKSQYGFHESQYKHSLSVIDNDNYGSKSGTSPRHSVSSTSSAGSCKDTSRKSVSFAKLTRLLSTSKDRYSESKGSGLQLSGENSTDVRPNDKVKRSGSVDSLIDAQHYPKSEANFVSIGNYLETNATDNAVLRKRDKSIRLKDQLAINAIHTIPSAYLFQSQRNLQDIPLSPTSSQRISKALTGRNRQASVDVFVPNDLPFMTKSEKKKFEKFNKFNFDLQAMFSAVESEQLERTRMIIESTDVDINSCNCDGFTPLDIAVMTLNIPLIKLLQSYGCKESPNFASKESRERQLNSLLREAERCVLDLNFTVFGALTHSGLSQALVKEKERQLYLWQRRLKLLKRMKLGFDKLEPPEPSDSVILEVVGNECLRLKFNGPVVSNEYKSIVTKYKVEWSVDSFTTIDGNLLITDLQRLEVVIDRLVSGQKYFVRVSSGNCKGFSSQAYPTPDNGIPSSWRDINDRPSVSVDVNSRLNEIFQQIADCRPNSCPEVKVVLIESEAHTHSQPQPQQPRKGQVRKSIKSLFGSTSKFQKALKRGIYLAALLYNDDRILVTNDEILPVVEIDDVYPSSLQTDFYWMLKISSTWEDVKALRRELDKSQSSSVAHFRSKILSAVEHMQTALGILDLGKLFYKPLRDSDSTTALCTIKKLVDVKSMNCLSLRWLPISKLQKKVFNASTAETSEASQSSALIGDLLLSSLQEMICYHKACNNPLPRGLYLGLVKLKSSVETMSIVVPQHSPNVMPHIKVRDNPHVSREEWTCLRECLTGADCRCGSDSPQLKFLQLISKSTNFLCSAMKVQNEISNHRVYDIEVIELSPEVSFVLLLPPVESVCSLFGQTDEAEVWPCALIYLPLRIFELINMNTYQQTFVSRYSRISVILEMDILVAQQAQREAFSSNEVMATKSRLNRLQEYQSVLDELWRSKRWIMNVVTFARDKSVNGIPLHQITTCLANSNVVFDEESVFQIPVINLSSPTHESPATSPPPHQISRRPSRDDSVIDTNYFNDQLKINTSSSSYSFIDSLYFMNSDYKSETYTPKSYDDMRRCVSASKLIDGSLRANRIRDQSRGQNQIAGRPIHLSDECVRNKEQTNSDLSQSSEKSSDNDIKQLNLDLFGSSVLPNVSHEDNEEVSDQMEPIRQTEFLETPRSHRPVRRDSPSEPTDQTALKAKPYLIRVYIGYECGLPFGTSVKIQVTTETTVKEIIELVVKHLNAMAVKEESGSECESYESSDLNKFCIIAVFSSEVKHLNDDFKIVNLQTPWNRSKICIKFKDNLL